MNAKKLVLTRLTDDGNQTCGYLDVYDGISRVATFATIERPWKANARNVSCIPAGLYRVSPRQSAKLGHHLLVENVPGRDLICIHAANRVEQVEGCVAIGYGHADIDGDGDLDVSRSRAAMDLLLQFVGDQPAVLVVLRA